MVMTVQTISAIDKPDLGELRNELLRFWPSLNERQRVQLLEQIAAIDFEQISKLCSAEAHQGGARIARSAGAPTKLIPSDIRSKDPDQFRRASNIGWQALREGRVGVVLVAGGEGSRLGFPHAKGKFPIGPVSKKSLYQLLAEQLVTVSKRAGSTIPYYVMTSHSTHTETSEFFEEHDSFGLDRDSVHFFQQGRMPAVDQRTGRVLLADKDTISLSPDGHGGLLDAMSSARLFEDFRKRRLEILFYHQVDNPLVRVCDPAFLGFHLLNKADISTKVVAKEDPAEKVGLLVEIDGRHHMIEYVDLPREMAEEREATGALRLRSGNTAVHVFRCDFLERMAGEKDSLPYHRSSKAVSYVDDSGTVIHPTQTNAYKFEKFIFDILPKAQNPLAMEVVREHEFMPLKNRDGAFSADYVREAMRRLHTGWLKQAGWTSESDLPLEIPACVALDADEFVDRAGKPFPVTPAD
jgi:UDP-N-acetylglucosamine/UDP-N-acetylgalactosamine diphosphorylase